MRETPDLRRLARALIELARLQAEADAQAEIEQTGTAPAAKSPSRPGAKRPASKKTGEAA